MGPSCAVAQLGMTKCCAIKLCLSATLDMLADANFIEECIVTNIYQLRKLHVNINLIKCDVRWAEAWTDLADY